MAKESFTKDPVLKVLHQDTLRYYLLKQKPEAKFVEEALHYGPWLPPPGLINEIRGIDLNAESYNEAEYDRLCRYAVFAAMRTLIRWRDVYVSKFIEKNEVKQALFGMDPDNRFTEFIPMVYGAVSYATFEREVNGSDEYLEYDEFCAPVTYAKDAKPAPSKFVDDCQYLGFSSPPYTTNLQCSCQGFLIVRHNQIIALVITFHS